MIAIERGYLDCVCMLLMDKRVSSSMDFDAAIELATTYDHEGIIDALQLVSNTSSL